MGLKKRCNKTCLLSVLCFTVKAKWTITSVAGDPTWEGRWCNHSPKFLAFSIFRPEPALDKISHKEEECMVQYVEYPECASYQLPCKHGVTHFLGSLMLLEFRLWEPVSSSQLGPESQKASSQGKWRLASHGGWAPGHEAKFHKHTSAVWSAPASAWDPVTESTAGPHLEVSVCVLHIFARWRRPAVSQREWCCQFLATHADSDNTDGYLSGVGLFKETRTPLQFTDGYWI